jgi:DNA invertase Pin-like site-specific DNA recombinase
MGWTVAAVFSETASGASTDGRTEFLTMLQAITAKRKEFDKVLALRPDRLARSVADLSQLIQTARKHGVDIATVENALDSGTPVGSMIFSILASVAELELSLIRQRTRDSFERRRQLGLRAGGNLGYGFTLGPDGVHVALDPARVPVVREIFQRRARGESLSAIAAGLNAKAERNPSYKPATAKRWNPKSPQVVSQILANADAYRPHIPDLPETAVERGR